MTENGQAPDTQLQAEEIPEAIVDRGRHISLVWLVPLVALLITLWLGYHAYIQEGPLVTIHFDTAEGLEAGKTKVRFKDVDIGQVESIDLAPDLGGINVQVRVKPQMAEYLNEKARFWVVRPRLSRGQISGLGTLIGGAYIAADLAPDNQPKRDFRGLEEPPVVTYSAHGSAFTLVANSLGSLAEGSPVLFRGIEVGRVTGYHLRPDGKVAILVFINAPHDRQVNSGTRFWNASGFGMTLDASGLHFNSGSIASVLLGGVDFGNPDDAQKAGKALAEYPLFTNKRSAMAPVFSRRDQWQVHFSGSVRGLTKGAPVELRGIHIGKVESIQLKLDATHGHIDIPVIIAIEPGRLGLPPDISQAQRRVLWNRMVAKGLRAELKTGNLLTGATYVDLNFDSSAVAGKARIDWQQTPPGLPSVPTAFDQLRQLLGKLAQLPLQQMGQNLAGSLAEMRKTLKTTNRVLNRLDRETLSELNRTLAKSRDTLGAMNRVLAPNSPLQSQAQQVLRQFGEAARSMRELMDYLDRHPESLLLGKERP